MDGLPSSSMGRLLELARTRGPLRPRDLGELGIPRSYLRRLVERGQLVKIGRGLYELAEAEATEHHALASAARRAPKGVICLASALAFHELTSQLPHQVWVAIETGAWEPRSDRPRLRIVRMAGDAFTAGAIEHMIDSTPVRIYNPAKTVADCFRFRHKIGVDVAIEALREYHRQRRGSLEELMHYARIDRVANVLQPYLESLT